MTEEKTELFNKEEIFRTELLPIIEALTIRCDELNIPHVMTFLFAENTDSCDYYSVTAFHQNEDDGYPDIEINYFKLLDTLIWNNGVVME